MLTITDEQSAFSGQSCSSHQRGRTRCGRTRARHGLLARHGRPKPAVKAATWLYTSRSGDNGVTFGPSDRNQFASPWPPYTIGSPIVIVLGAALRVPLLLLISVITFTTFPTANGPSAFPLASHGAL